MNQTPMDGLLVGTFPDGLDLYHASPQTGGSDLIEILRLVMSQPLRPQELRFLDAEYPDSLRISDMCPKWMDGPDEILGFMTSVVLDASSSGLMKL